MTPAQAIKDEAGDHLAFDAVVAELAARVRAQR